jgi:PhzF family phenazine biosynthesis protein
MIILEYAAFTTDPAGGNPAGIVFQGSATSESEMLETAAEVGYSETVFLSPRTTREFDARYFSPLAEVPFCGHATIAAAVAYAERHGAGPLSLNTSVGRIEVVTALRAGQLQATLTTVEPRTASLADAELEALLDTLRWSREILDPLLPVRLAYAGEWHPIIAVRSRAQLTDLAYDFDALAQLMNQQNWVTINLLWRESEDRFHARNPFPTGGVTEDPATGAAAGALGGYLRELALVEVPSTITILQGEDLGRPSMLTVGIPSSGGIEVSGAAVPISRD